MDKGDQFRFVSLLALELDNGDVTLPSLPDVVTKIRGMLEKEDCDFEQVSQAVSIDPVLVSRLFVFANSVFYNRANVKIETLEDAIGRLGFDVVRSAAMSVAMKQLYNSDKKHASAKHLRAIWARGMKLSSMAHSIAKRGGLNQESAYLCGLMHDVGKLYILTKVDEFPEFLGDPDSLNAVMQEWNPQISKSIIESWGFPEDVIESTDPATYLDHEIDTPANLVDVVCVAKLLVDGGEEKLATVFEKNLSCQKLGVTVAAAAEIMVAYRDKLQTMQQSLA